MHTFGLNNILFPYISYLQFYNYIYALSSINKTDLRDFFMLKAITTYIKLNFILICLQGKLLNGMILNSIVEYCYLWINPGNRH